MNPSDVSVLAGEVIDTSRLSHTEVWSSGGGGGGYVGPHGGNVSVSAPTVHSRATTNTDIFLRDKQGKEHHVRVHDRDIPLRPGHQIELAYVKTGPDWELAVLNNLSTNKYWELDCAGISRGMGCFATLLNLIWGLCGLASLIAFIWAAVRAFEGHFDSSTALIAGAFVVTCVIGNWLRRLETRLRFGPYQRAIEKAKKALNLVPASNPKLSKP